MISVNKWSLTRSALFLSPIVLMAGAAVNAMQLQNNTANTDSGSTSFSGRLLSFGCWVPSLPPPVLSSSSSSPSPLQILHYAVPSLEPRFQTLPAPLLDCDLAPSSSSSSSWVLIGSDSKTSLASCWERMWMIEIGNAEKGWRDCSISGRIWGETNHLQMTLTLQLALAITDT